MCGIIGMLAQGPVNQNLYDGLTVLQHRGQDAAGIMTSDGQHVYLRKDNGFVRDVFQEAHMHRLQGHIGIGHVRYPTAGNDSPAEAQPFYINAPYGLALAHNGNLTNADQLRKELFERDRRLLNTSSDSEILLNVLAQELQAAAKGELTADQVFKAVEGVHRRCRGAYAVIAMVVGYGLIAFRDPHGIRPLVYGRRHSEKGEEYIIASESVALNVIDFDIVDDVQPGEAIYIDMKSEVHRRKCVKNTEHTPCIFEYVYLARPDSIIDGIAVYSTRLRMGQTLARKIQREWSKHDIDVIIPIPDTSRTSALEMAHVLGVDYREGFVKNRYIGRTFIMPGQALRRRSVRQKLNAIEMEFEGKNVLLVDDSIVRGTTSQQIIQMAREAGAKKVYFASAAPPVRYPNVYGIDMPSANELIGHDREVEQITKEIGADRLFFQDLPDLIEAVRGDNKKIKHFETSIFDGIYVTGDVDKAYLSRLDAVRNQEARQKNTPFNDVAASKYQSSTH